MLNSKTVKEYLEQNGLEEIDEIEYKKGFLVYNLFYPFDKPEIEAAEVYANENCSKDAANDAWYEEHYLPYLIDIAADNVGDILDEACEKFDIQGEFVAYEIDRNYSQQCEFVVVFTDAKTGLDIDEVLENIEI